MRSSIREYQEHDSWKGYRAAVSLHSHTHHSREKMADLPRYIARIPLVAVAFEREVGKYHEREGRPIDFSRGWWHPPVSPRAVFESEARQIEERFELPPLVSVTDHDDILAGLELQELYANRRAPVSFEWTVPYGEGFFHIGVNNLPVETARDWYGRLNAFTTRVSREPLSAIFSDLQALRSTLLVFCHPLWDLAGVGTGEHARQLRRFMAAHRSHLHAIELNGYRARKENAGAQALALSAGLPLISGGDRHGCAPNAILNVTRAGSFAEFVCEVRAGASEVVFMPEYRQNLTTRKLAAASDVLRRYGSDRTGRIHWTDRVTWERDGAIRPLSFHWPDGGPFWVRSSVRAFRLIASPVMLPMIGAALNTVEDVRSVRFPAESVRP
ncbi:MAG TPA: hypothetical protein VJM31_13620 [Vicinamibacterales bacterium]|nr:hypothetical protein [Vicinamibacterales bacterium]